MSSFLQYGSLVRPRPGFRPVVIGALTCSALMISAGAAQANHKVMADGTMCPHAAGTLAPGESKSAPPVERAASSGPIGAVKTAPAAPAPRPAAKPAAQPAANVPVQRPAAQAQAQKPAASQVQAQRPAGAAQPAVSKARVAVPVQRQAPVAKPSAAKQPQAATSKSSAAKKQVSRASKQQVSPPAVKPAVTAEITTDRRGAIERPAATAAVAAPADSGASASVAMLVGSFGLLALVVIAGIVAVRRRVVRVKSAAPSPTLAESMDTAIEAELQDMIIETRARALLASAGLEDEHDDLELSQTR